MNTTPQLYSICPDRSRPSSECSRLRRSLQSLDRVMRRRVGLQLLRRIPAKIGSLNEVSGFEIWQGHCCFMRQVIKCDGREQRVVHPKFKLEISRHLKFRRWRRGQRKALKLQPSNSGPQSIPENETSRGTHARGHLSEVLTLSGADRYAVLSAPIWRSLNVSLRVITQSLYWLGQGGSIGGFVDRFATMNQHTRTFHPTRQ